MNGGIHLTKGADMNGQSSDACRNIEGASTHRPAMSRLRWAACCRLPVWLGLALLLWPVLSQSAEEPAAATVGTEPAAAAAADREAGAAASQPVKPLREQSIYIPYEKLRHVFEKQGRGVFLPYEEFEALWKAARQRDPATAEVKPPVGALIVESENEAVAEKDVVRVKCRLKIEVLSQGWVEVPLRLSDAAISKAMMDGAPARLLGEPGHDHRVLIENPTKKPKTVTLDLEYAKTITRAPGQNSVSFQTPQSPVSRWQITVPQAGVNVNVQPLLAATEVPTAGPGAGGALPAAGAERTTIMAFVGAAPSVRIDWTPKAEGAAGLAALASVQAEQHSAVAEGVVRTRAVLNYAISRAELSELVVEAPADQKIVSVFDDNVRQWTAAEAEGKQKLTIQLFEPAKSSQRLTIEMEKFFDDAAATTIETPMIRAVGVGRQQGVVAVSVAAGLRADAAKTTGLLQIDQAELPAALRGAQAALAYRYAAVPYSLTFDVEKVQPRLLADTLTEVHLNAERLMLDITAAITVERSGVFRLEFDIPEGYQLRRVVGRALPAGKDGEVPAASPAQIDNHHLEGEKKTRLVVNLSQKALGRIGLLCELQQDLAQRDLLAQPGKKVALPLAVPRAAGAALERNRGRLVIFAPESLRVEVEKPLGLGEMRLDEVYDGFVTAREAKPGDSRPLSSWSFAEEPAGLTIQAERRQPKVTVQQLLAVRIESGVARFECSLNYDVQYSGVKSLRLDLPAAIAAKVRNETPTVPEKPIDPQPDDLAKGDVAWNLTGENELFGRGAVRLVWEEPLEKLQVGKSVVLAIPHLKPRGVDRAWGQIVLSKAESLDVSTPSETPGLRPIDPQVDLNPPQPQAARAFEFHDAWTLEVTITQFELEEIKRTSIERGVVRAVLTPAGETSVQALYRIRSARQRLEIKLPENAGFAAAPLRINGKAVVLERGMAGQYFAPLTGAEPDTPMLVELRYTVPDSGRRLTIPQFPEEPAVMKVFLCVYLPPEEALLGSRGKWSGEFGWWLDPAGLWRPQVRTTVGSSDQDLLRWVSEGLETGPIADFQTDGTLFVFSTLAPAPSPEGDLHLSMLRRELLRAAVFLIAIACGVLLLPAPWSRRFAAIGVAVVLIALGGVFLPTFSLQVLDGVFFTAAMVVAVLWLVWHFLRMPRRAAIAADAAGPSAPAPVAPTPAKPLGGVAAGIDLTKQPAGESAEEPTPKTDSDGGKSHE